MRWIRKILGALTWAIIGIVGTGFAIYVLNARQLPDLEIWHEPDLMEDFREVDSGISFAALLQIEERLFAFLEDRVRAQGRTGPTTTFSRYNPESPANPARQSRNWNRTFEFEAEDAVGGVLLLHGLSDAPYSLRAVAEHMHAAGWHVLGLRLPGHGTTPGELSDTFWRDWREAVRVAANALSESVGRERPLIVVGYSNGTALAVDYTLGAIEGSGDAIPDRIFMLSPAMGVSPVAALSRLMLRLAELPGLEKLAWTTIQPEFDPFKYNSFPVRAGEQIFELTKQAEGRLRALVSDGRIDVFPPVIAFQSVVDATVPPGAIVDRLLVHLGSNGSALVLFDVNRLAKVEPFMRSGHDELLNRLTRAPTSFDLTVVSNRTPETRTVVARTRLAGEERWQEEDLEMAWPRSVYSLSHIAIPIPQSDPLYGPRNPSATAQPFSLGSLEQRGERGVFGLPMDQLMRLRYNPFFPYIEARIAAELQRVRP